MIRTAVILAGGMGTRLGQVIQDIPKPMAPVAGIPFIEYLFRYVASEGIKKVIISTGYKADVIENHYGDNFDGLKLIYAHETEPLGTGGGLANAFSFIPEMEPIVVLNGDTYFPVDLFSMYRFHMTCNADFTLAARRVFDLSRYGTLHVNEENRVVAFREKGQPGEGLVNGGVYILSPDLLSRLKLSEKFSLEHDLLQKHVDKINICAYFSDAYFIDIGIPEDYYRADKELPNLTRK